MPHWARATEATQGEHSFIKKHFRHNTPIQLDSILLTVRCLLCVTRSNGDNGTKDDPALPQIAMIREVQKQTQTPQTDTRIKIYFLPNLMTAGNLFCGFVALTKIVEADLAEGYQQIKVALGFILLACIFDLFDGRVARMGGVESPFGREFDSLADLISFGVAPAFLVHRVVLKNVFEGHADWGWFIASVYLTCGAFRLARFNCLSTQAGGPAKEFLGFPIPSAAGLVASLTLLIIQLNEKDKSLGHWNYLLAVVLVLLSAMM